MATAHCPFHIMITTLKVKVYFLVPNYNYSNPLNSINIVDFIKFYNPDIINPYIKLLPKMVILNCLHGQNLILQKGLQGKM